MASTMACTCIMLWNPKKRPPHGQHPTQQFVKQIHNKMADEANNNNEEMDEEEEKDSNKDPDLKQAAETQQPSP